MLYPPFVCRFANVRLNANNGDVFALSFVRRRQDDDDDAVAAIACYSRAITYLHIPNHEVSIDNLMLITYRIDSFSRIISSSIDAMNARYVINA